MRLYTQAQVAKMCREAGFSRKNARIASAIAMCEAPGPKVDGKPTCDADAVGDQDLADDTWGFSYGFFQVRSLREQKGTGDIRDEEGLVRPKFNVRSAYAIWKSAGFRAWTTYTSGMYKAFLQKEYPPEPNTYVVMPGDTLSEVAELYGGKFTWQELAELNNIDDPTDLQIGQVLKLPT